MGIDWEIDLWSDELMNQYNNTSHISVGVRPMLDEWVLSGECKYGSIVKRNREISIEKK